MTARVCPASGKRCACAPGSIRALECERVALHARANAQMKARTPARAANEFQRRLREAA